MSSVDLAEPEKLKKVAEALAQSERLRQEKHYQEGIDLLIEALKYGTNKAQIYFRLGNIYYDAGDLAHAEYAYRKAIDHDPQHINAHHNLAVVYKKQGRIAESIKMRKRANSLARQHPDKVQLNKEQIKQIRSYANKVIIFVGVLLAVIIIVILLLAKF